MKFIKTFESYNEKPINETFKSLNDGQKEALLKIVDQIKDESAERELHNSEVHNPEGKAHSTYRASRKAEGLGKTFASIVTGSVEKEDGFIIALVKHGVEFESGLNREHTSKISMDDKTMEYNIERIDNDL